MRQKIIGFSTTNSADITNLPEHLLEPECVDSSDLLIFNYEVNKNASKNKINLNKNVISFLLDGEKNIHFSNNKVSINNTQSLLITSGNFLMTELVGANSFRCMLLFFSTKNITDFLLKHSPLFKHIDLNKKAEGTPYFLIHNDDFIVHFINSLQHSFGLRKLISQKILELKFEEIMLYLANKYEQNFFAYLNSLLLSERELSFKMIIEKNLSTNLTIEEIAFLCNMSLSTFKRKFVSLYQESPGKWFQQRRLNKARALLLNNNSTPSEIYMDFGYDSLSSFSAAFKNEFGYSPKQVSSI